MRKNSTDELSLDSVLWSVYLENKEPNFYVSVPHILNHLTYDYIDPKTGKKELRRLSVYAQHFYKVLKEIIGEGEASWKNTENLAKLSNMSVGQIVKVKKELQQKFHQLDGNSLISIKKNSKNTFVNRKLKNKTFYDEIIIAPINFELLKGV